MIKKGRIPTILGVILLVAATFAGVFFVNYQQIFKLGASGETEPHDVRVSNITDSSFTVSWTTNRETIGFVIWNRGVTIPTEMGYSHSSTISGLRPSTEYTYKINSNGTVYDNNGVPWITSTSDVSLISTNLIKVSGSVLTSTGQAKKGIFVYVNGDGRLFSTTTSASGNFVLTLPETFPIGSTVELVAQGGPLGVSSAQIIIKETQFLPPMILGSTHDFRDITATIDTEVPDASLNLPAENEEESKFIIPDLNQTPVTTAAVTLESVDESEQITSTQPEFFGNGPAGATLTITVQSENPMTGQINVGGNGTWDWTPPDNLAPGPHKITITWKDIRGITRILTRNFVVQAGEVPAFEASSSASLAPSPSQTPGPSAQPTTTPQATATATPAPVPQTGNLTPTLLLGIMGMLVLLFSTKVWKMSQNENI